MSSYPFEKIELKWQKFWEDNQIFRVVILPADLANDPTLDITDYNSVMHLGGITETDILKVE